MKKFSVVCRVSRTVAGLLLLFGLMLAAHAKDEKVELDIGYYALKPSIVSNLSGGPKYIRCDIQLMTEDAASLPLIELHSPAVRHSILMLIAAEDGKQLKTRDGKEKLRQAALASVQQQLAELTGDSLVADLYFTAYYVK